MEYLPYALLAIIMVIGTSLFIVFRRRSPKNGELVLKSTNCHYCGTEVSEDFIVMYRNGNFERVVCGKKKCNELYNNEHEKLTNDEQADIPTLPGE